MLYIYEIIHLFKLLVGLQIIRGNHYFTQQKLSVWEEMVHYIQPTPGLCQHLILQRTAMMALTSKAVMYCGQNWSPSINTKKISTTLIRFDQHTLSVHHQKVWFNNQTCWFHLISSTQLKMKRTEFPMLPKNEGHHSTGNGNVFVCVSI